MARITTKRRRAPKGKQQSCKICGCEDKFDFTVPNRLWRQVVPAAYRNKVVCLECFDKLAFEKGVDYADFIERLYFAGEQATFTFATVAAQSA